MKVGDLLCRPARVVVANLKPRLHPLDVRALLEEILIGAVVLQQVEQQQQTVLHHNTCTENQPFTSKHQQVAASCTETRTPFTSVTAALLCDDIKETLKRVFKRHNFLNGGIAFGELLK